MFRVPYELLSLEVDKLLNKMVNAPQGEITIYKSKYLKLINNFGWTDFEYDQETLRRIDSSWEKTNYILH